MCNAGVLLNERSETAEGHEVTFASHLLFGSFYLGRLLKPRMDKSEGRIVFVSSGGMYNTKWPAWPVAVGARDSTEPYSGNMAYAYAKRGQVLLARYWAQKWQATGPKVVR